ncbi:TPA-induced transmembrane protein isoform 2-T2 [Odontesthes bonariensis]|uniref:TPA-induced transmembrane protein isoform X2 n=1 Tax=Odontesthes bonariensis TaxID=219752 RepID=UPI003F5865C7
MDIGIELRNVENEAATSMADIPDGVKVNADDTETDVFLPVPVSSNGEIPGDDHRTGGLRNGGDRNNTRLENSSVSRIKKELREKVFWKVRLWMIILFIFVLIIVVILISLALCSVIHDDEDEKFDPSLFKIPQYFNGSFQMQNLSFTESEKPAELQNKLAELYRSSPALGRYFSKAELHAARNDSVVIEYELTFVLPEEQQEELRNFTLSREMVYNVFRQFLYEQEPLESGMTYIDPVSLKMSSAN